MARGDVDVPAKGQPLYSRSSRLYQWQDGPPARAKVWGTLSTSSVKIFRTAIQWVISAGNPMKKRDVFESLSYKTCAFSSSRMDSELTLRCLASTVLPVITNLLFEVGNWQAIQLKSLKSCAWRRVAIKGVPKMLQFSCLTSPNDGWTSAIFEKRSWVHIIFDPFWSILLGSSFRVQVSPKFAPGGYSKKSVM